MRFLTQKWEDFAYQNSGHTVSDAPHIDIFESKEDPEDPKDKDELPDQWILWIPLLFLLFLVRFSFDVLALIYGRMLDSYLFRGFLMIAKIYFHVWMYLANFGIVIVAKMKEVILHWMVWWNSVDFTETKSVLMQCTVGKMNHENHQFENKRLFFWLILSEYY